MALNLKAEGRKVLHLPTRKPLSDRSPEHRPDEQSRDGDRPDHDSFDRDRRDADQGLIQGSPAGRAVVKPPYGN